MKQKEDNRTLFARLEADRQRLTDLLKEWPYERRLSDQLGYTDALKAWYASCQFESPEE
jgi:hypothetical protein